MVLKASTYVEKMYHLLREGLIVEFNTRKANGEKSALINCDFRNLDLRGLDANGLDLSGCYFRQADLRGIDFTACRLEGASLNGARISGVLFPQELTAEEITLSLLHGTRMRHQS